MKLNQATVVKAVRIHSLKMAWMLAAATLLSGAAAQGAELGIVSGSVEIGRGQPTSWRSAKSGQELSPGDRIRTGRGAQAEIRLDSGTVRLYGNSLLHLPMIPAVKSSRDEVTLDSGKSLFDVIRRLSGRRFEVQTPEVVVSVKGTRFSVDLTGELASVAVFRGTVGVRELGAELALETLVREGFAATGGPGAPFELKLAPEIDPWDLWEKGPAGTEPSPGDLEQPGDRQQDSLSKARETARRVSSEEVLRHAVRRNPDVAARLRELVEKKKIERRFRKRGDKQSALPAAPAPVVGTLRQQGDAPLIEPPPLERPEEPGPGADENLQPTDWDDSALEPQDHPPEPPLTGAGTDDTLPDDLLDDPSFKWGDLAEMLSNPNSGLIPALLARNHSPMEVRYTLKEVTTGVLDERKAARSEGVEIDASWVVSTLTQKIVSSGWGDGEVDVFLDYIDPLLDAGDDEGDEDDD